MAKQNQNARISAGDVLSLGFQILDESTGAPAVLANPVGYWALGAYPQALNDETPLLTKSSPANGVTMVQEVLNGVSTWVLYVKLSETDTEKIPPGAHYHEARVVDGNNVTTVARGTLTIDTTIIR